MSHKFKSEIDFFKNGLVKGLEAVAQEQLPEVRAALERIDSGLGGVTSPSKEVTVGASVDQLEREFSQQVAPFATLNDWSTFVNAWADSKGWNEKSILGEDGTIRNEFLGEQLMLIVTEVAEAQEDNRKGKLTTYLEEGTGKPCGFPSEMADWLIRTFHLAARMGIDLNAEVAKKMAYNYSRSKRHGGLRS